MDLVAAVLRSIFEADHAEVRCRIDCEGPDAVPGFQAAALAEPVAEFAAEQRSFDLTASGERVTRRLDGFCKRHKEGCRGADAGHAKVDCQLRLQFAAARARWNHRRADGAQSLVEQKAGRYEMIGPGIEHSIAGAKAGSSKGRTEATAVAIVRQLRFVDGAR